MTPRRLTTAFAAKSKIMERDYQGRAWLAWHVAALTRMDAKKFPTLDAIMGVKREARRQSPEEIRRNLRLMFPEMPT